MKKILFCVIAFLLVACAPVPSRVSLPTPVAPIPARMLFPLYVYPGTNGAAWQPVINANTYRNIDVIVNPSNGPGLSRNVNYVNGIAKLREAGIGVYGYVHSTYGARPITQVKTDIDTWLAWYSPLVGIFVDEAEYRPGQGDEGYYAELYAYINTKGLKVINNPGTGTIEGYINFADTTCIFESAVTKSFTFPSWGWNYQPTKFCYLAHSASVEQMRDAIYKTSRSNIGYVYITSVSSGDYWESIPTYLAEEAALLAGGGEVPATPIVANTKTATPTIPQTVAPQTITPTITLTAIPTKTPTPKPEVCIALVPTITIDGVGRNQICFR